MDATQQELWANLKAFELDDPTASLPFSVRLARENSWTLRQAQQAVFEYKRFVFLTAVAGHSVCPSEAVDAVWHAHLCYTRSYWQDLCGELLGRPLHHEPTRGGTDQLEYHRQMYNQTLEDYRLFFGEFPPEVFWPSVDDRFAHGGRDRHINTAEHWVLPKPRLPRLVKSWLRQWSLSGVGAIVLIPTLGVVLNPLDMRGPTFLKLYVALLALACMGGYFLRRLLLSQGEGLLDRELRPLEVAALAGGEEQAMQVALSQLLYEGHLVMDTSDGITMQAVKPLGKKIHPLTDAMFQAIERNGEATLSTAWNAARPHAARIAAKLEKKGLLANSTSRFLARWIPMTILGSVLVLGASKVWVGLTREKPVGFLILLSCVTFLALIFFAIRPWRNQQGNRELRKLKKQHRKIKKTKNLPDSETQLLMQWSLYGMSAMLITGGAVTALHNWIQPVRQSSSGGIGSAGCGGGGGGGGGGGCGGGCGGCGN